MQSVVGIKPDLADELCFFKNLVAQKLGCSLDMVIVPVGQYPEINRFSGFFKPFHEWKNGFLKAFGRATINQEVVPSTISVGETQVDGIRIIYREEANGYAMDKQHIQGRFDDVKINQEASIEPLRIDSNEKSWMPIYSIRSHKHGKSRKPALF